MKGKRTSGPPRRPRDPVAKAVRTPRFKQQVVPDKRWREKQKSVDPHEKEPET
jgi:hypothetical protein